MKKNLFTKIAAVSLSAALSVTMLAGCGNKKVRQRMNKEGQ